MLSDSTFNTNDKIFKELIEAAAGETNIMYPIKSLLVKDVSLSQIIDVLKLQWGSYQN